MTGYAIHDPGSLPGQIVLARRKLTAQQLSSALTLWSQTHERIGTFIGITDDAVFYSCDENWNPRQPGAFDDLRFIPWAVIDEVLRGLQ